MGWRKEGTNHLEEIIAEVTITTMEIVSNEEG